MYLVLGPDKPSELILQALYFFVLCGPVCANQAH